MMETTSISEPTKGKDDDLEKIDTDDAKGTENRPSSAASSSSSTDYYQILGVPRDATEKQINAAYKKLALQYHPDRSNDKEVSEAKFRELNDAYHILIDPNKRRQYDLKGDKGIASSDFESVDVSTLGGIGRVFGAVISRFGIPIPTQISQDILSTAQIICRNGSIEGGGPPLDARVSDLTWGWGAEGKVDRQAGIFYRLTVDAQHSDAGFLINCRSSNRGKFKLILFDKEGSVLFQEESTKEKERNYTQATLFFTNFDTYRLGEVFLPAQDKSSQSTALPILFSRLDNFLLSKHKLNSGQYLLCVYGDNFIGKTNFNIIAVPAKNDSSEVHSLEDIDEKLLETKSLLNTLKSEYVQAKAAFESVLGKIKNEEDKLYRALSERERLYNAYVDNSVTVFAPAESAKLHTAEPQVDANTSATDTNNSDEASHSLASTDGSTNSNTSRFAFLSANTLAAATALSSTAALNAANNVTAAGGWLARRLSFGIQSIVNTSSVKSEDGVSEEAPSNVADAGDGSVVSDNDTHLVTATAEDPAPTVSHTLSVDSTATSGVAESVTSN